MMIACPTHSKETVAHALVRAASALVPKPLPPR
jgi:hypothetical protein